MIEHLCADFEQVCYDALQFWRAEYCRQYFFGNLFEYIAHQINTRYEIVPNLDNKRRDLYNKIVGCNSGIDRFNDCVLELRIFEKFINKHRILLLELQSDIGCCCEWCQDIGKQNKEYQQFKKSKKETNDTDEEYSQK